MLDEGYAAVTYRVLAARAGVTGGLVQYYFPTLDDLFLALLERRSESSLERLRSTLETRPDETLRIVWEFSTDETSATLLIEFMALANHRKMMGAAILEVIERTRHGTARRAPLAVGRVPLAGWPLAGGTPLPASWDPEDDPARGSGRHVVGASGGSQVRHTTARRRGTATEIEAQGAAKAAGNDDAARAQAHGSPLRTRASGVERAVHREGE